MPYKKSRFNFTYRQSEDAYVVFNTYSKALVVLSSAEFEQFNAQHFDDSQMVRELADNGILVDETFDEIGFMTYCHNMTKFSKGSLHLVLATTMDCNFACPYCYENRRKGKMSIAVQDAIVQFIEANINDGVHKLDVTWYGGEPLLYPDIVESLAARIRSLADRSGCELTMYMVTNGYLFTPDLVELIDRIGVVKVQITLDGLKEHHDSRRHLRDGRGTFDKIIENLRLFEEYAIRVDIRMNVDNENCRDYIGLQQKLAELDNPNVVLYPSPVEDINPDTENEVSDFMTFDEFEKFVRRVTQPQLPPKSLMTGIVTVKPKQKTAMLLTNWVTAISVGIRSDVWRHAALTLHLLTKRIIPTLSSLCLGIHFEMRNAVSVFSSLSVLAAASFTG